MADSSEWAAPGTLRPFPAGVGYGRYRVYCYICGDTFWLRSLWHKKKPGVYSPSEMVDSSRIRDLKEWNIFYRMILLNPQTGQCKTSGAAVFDYNHHREAAVPLDPDQGIIGADSVNRSRLASPYVHCPFDENPKFEPGTILGYPVHVRCWDFLVVHKLGAFVENHLPVILHALKQQYRGNIDEYIPVDPGIVQPIQRLIFKARRRKRPRFQTKQYKNRDHCRLYRDLPAEVLLMVLVNLETMDIAAAQEAIGLYLGDKFWRSRISPDVFFEVGRIGKEENLDWTFLCVELEQLDLDELEGMKHRRSILRRLDQAERLVRCIVSNESQS